MRALEPKNGEVEMKVLPSRPTNFFVYHDPETEKYSRFENGEWVPFDYQQTETFEIGKCYRHCGGASMYVCGGPIKTHMWGETIVAERNFPGVMTQLDPIGINDGATVGWYEITEDEYLKENYS